MTRLFAISDLHLGCEENRRAMEQFPARPHDWLILGGDLGEKLEHVELAFSHLRSGFARVLWTPGNHELWTERVGSRKLAGMDKYRALLELARKYDVLTPEDPYPECQLEGTTYRVVLLFLLYDYSFRPRRIARSGALAWAAESGIRCPDEVHLDPVPYASRQAWCTDRVRSAEKRLAKLGTETPTILVNHFPLRRDLVFLPETPRYELWCGTRMTEDWHTRFAAGAVIHGHLHLRRTTIRDGVPFTDVSLGYPGEWPKVREFASLLHQIEPAKRE